MGRAQQPADEATLAQLEHELCAMSVNPNPVRAAEIFADDYSAIGSRGRVTTKADAVRAPGTSSPNRTEACSESDVKVRVYGDAAVVTGLGTRSGTFNGVRYKDRKILWVDTFIRRRGRWQIVASGSTLSAEQQAPGIRGAWRVTEITTAGPNATTNSNPLPSLYLFTDGHYTLVQEDGTTPRRSRPSAEDSSQQNLMEAMRFSAQGGTYEISGNELVMRRIVALAASNMVPGNFRRNTFRIAGDTLWLTTVATQTGPSPVRTTMKLRRVE
jgi:hypothetical protein